MFNMRKKANAFKKSLDLEMNPYYHAYTTATEFIKSRGLWNEYQSFAEDKERCKNAKKINEK